MRLDHLLSREKARREIRSLHLRSIHRNVWMRKDQTKSLAVDCSSSWTCIVFRDRKILESTLKTAQPDGKTSCKETSCECVWKNIWAQKCDNFAVGLRISNQSKTLTATQSWRSSYEGRRVDAMALDAEERRGKLRKATGSRKQALIRGCLNGETRRK